MTTPMPTIFDVNAQPEESDFFMPTDADYAGDPDHDYPACPICGDPIDYCQGHGEDNTKDFCINCGLVKDVSPSPFCDDCDQALYDELMNNLYEQLFSYR